MKLVYDGQADSAAIYFNGEPALGAVARTEVADAELDGSSLVLDFDADDKLIAIEILGASRLLPESVLKPNDHGK